MKISKLLMLLFIVVSTLMSCQKYAKDNVDVEHISDVNMDLISFCADCNGSDFSTDISTKATSEVKKLESFLVTATTGTYGSETSVWSETLFEKSSGTSTVYTSDKYWPVSDPNYHFYASNVSMTSTTECKVQGNSETDIVCAYLDKPVHRSNNTLNFYHIFSRIGQVSISSQEGYNISNVSVSISCPVSGTYDIYSGHGKSDNSGWTPNTAQKINLANGDNDVYVIPGNYLLNVSYKLTKGDWSKEFEKTANVSLTKGKINVISGTATGGDASDIQLSVSLTEWQTTQISVNWN